MPTAGLQLLALQRIGEYELGVPTVYGNGNHTRGNGLRKKPGGKGHYLGHIGSGPKKGQNTLPRLRKN